MAATSQSLAVGEERAQRETLEAAAGICAIHGPPSPMMTDGQVATRSHVDVCEWPAGGGRARLDVGAQRRHHGAPPASRLHSSGAAGALAALPVLLSSAPSPLHAASTLFTSTSTSSSTPSPTAHAHAHAHAARFPLLTVPSHTALRQLLCLLPDGLTCSLRAPSAQSACALGLQLPATALPADHEQQLKRAAELLPQSDRGTLPVVRAAVCPSRPAAAPLPCAVCRPVVAA
ncbi:hypothetical protein P154DRAFT_572409 [Amniculicola lignicola CBS 123094]|uniref:Uncharacterized protein n=1 Tax=Amniculicola lignicola CBS 123094 TaxID=1392246 RepID=A0A6A5X1D0_9PLEO|nr:hypothetical protein P154DRAFT_572409 [Amniculicola lignicola CBS 123094]